MPPLEVPTQIADDQSPESLAAAFRAQAYDLMDRSPIAAAHLVLAAATLAPECDNAHVGGRAAFTHRECAGELECGRR